MVSASVHQDLVGLHVVVHVDRMDLRNQGQRSVHARQDGQVHSATARRAKRVKMARSVVVQIVAYALRVNAYVTQNSLGQCVKICRALAPRLMLCVQAKAFVMVRPANVYATTQTKTLDQAVSMRNVLMTALAMVRVTPVQANVTVTPVMIVLRPGLVKTVALLLARMHVTTMASVFQARATVMKGIQARHVKSAYARTIAQATVCVQSRMRHVSVSQVFLEPTAVKLTILRHLQLHLPRQLPHALGVVQKHAYRMLSRILSNARKPATLAVFRKLSLILSHNKQQQNAQRVSGLVRKAEHGFQLVPRL